MKQRFRFVLAICILLLAGSSGCSLQTTGPDRELISSLDGRGPLPLSSTNPYLAANQLVMLQSSLYPVIHGFVENRGIPEAIEVKSETFGPTRMHFYYPAEREFFIFEQSGATWTVNGPARIPGTTLAGIMRIRGRNPSPPLLDPSAITQYGVTPAPLSIAGNPRTISSPYSESDSATPLASTSGSERDPFIDHLKKIERAHSRTPFKSVDKDSTFDTTLHSRIKPEESEEQKLLEQIKLQQQKETSGAAERAPNSDLIHYVDSEKETLNLITAWYTHEPKLAPSISRINEFKGKPLQMGDSVIIPGYMVIYDKRLTAEHTAALTAPAAAAPAIP